MGVNVVENVDLCNNECRVFISIIDTVSERFS
jgi:hypothetical protein